MYHQLFSENAALPAGEEEDQQLQHWRRMRRKEKTTRDLHQLLGIPVKEKMDHRSPTEEGRRQLREEEDLLRQLEAEAAAAAADSEAVNDGE